MVGPQIGLFRKLITEIIAVYSHVNSAFKLEENSSISIYWTARPIIILY